MSDLEQLAADVDAATIAYVDRCGDSGASLWAATDVLQRAWSTMMFSASAASFGERQAREAEQRRKRERGCRIARRMRLRPRSKVRARPMRGGGG